MRNIEKSTGTEVAFLSSQEFPEFGDDADAKTCC
jgi:hypothetical protein